MKYFFLSLALIIGVSSSCLAELSQMNFFLQTLQAKGPWVGSGSSAIYSGRFAGSYNINVTLSAVQNQDGTWSVTNDIQGVPPNPIRSVAIYRIVEDENHNQYLQVTSGQYSSYADYVTVDPQQISYEVSHTDSVSNVTITNSRQLILDNYGRLNVSVKNYQNNNEFQDFTYQLQPTH